MTAFVAVAVLSVGPVAGCRDDRGDLEAFCAAATDSRRFDGVFGDLDPEDVDEATATFRTALETEEQLQGDAPEAVRADIDVLVRFFEDLLEGLESADPGLTGRPPVYDELRPRFDQVQAASDRIATYVDANC